MAEHEDEMSEFPTRRHGRNARHVAKAKALYLANRRRTHHFGSLALPEQSWDMLLALYILNASGECPTVTRLTKLSAGPMTTALRVLQRFEASGFIIRHRHPDDSRLVLLELTRKARKALERYFDELVEIERTHSVW